MLNDWGTLFEKVMYKILYELTANIPAEKRTYRT
jgi:hypothetical protein